MISYKQLDDLLDKIVKEHNENKIDLLHEVIDISHEYKGTEKGRIDYISNELKKRYEVKANELERNIK